MKKNSLLIHGGISIDEKTGAVNIPIYQTSTYKQRSFGENSGYEYSRTGNPTRESLEKLIADTEYGKRGFAFASGLAAITAVLSLFKSGDKLLITNNLYGGTFRVIDKIFSNFGIGYEIIDDFTNIEEKIDESVKAIYIETPTNPLLDVIDIKIASDKAKKYNLLTIVDNTFMTPYFQNPLNLGADIVIHSATKYLGGHSDLVAGLVVVKDEELGEKIHFIQNSTGGILQPFDSFLLIRGIKTLSVRMDRHELNANFIAEKLGDLEGIDNVYYPGLKTHIGHDIQKKQASGFGGIISFTLNEKYNYEKFFNNLELITFGESLGGVESLACHPASMTHAAMPLELRERIGITDRLIRISVGIEDKEDILEDIQKALVKAGDKNEIL
ncbi:TPA: PLP-dependent aspartate aminotransferase family protein [Clostridium perfringens]|uniref:trans-sulfuration enzyme family protein n=1 Tax=Clostridium perfringens TaxID=1502 RepID=UPI000F5294A1|nr:PLP-dependent transferase [Clostridium perfringens]EJT6341962.1 PLP-dependent transferase [Clostridium perfringens]ELQ0173040.1 PLP-dependent transferase [Clostridium perfringens]UBK97850.1 PLP-dependent transferase [Clostridium perfringens]CAJ1610301.1 Cystathionine gamma-lyase [Clostridium perfringens]BDC00464.1 cystathionine gamma-synthase [Clostridium perfringens E]